MGQELVAQHVQVCGRIVIGVSRAVHAREAVTGRDPVHEGGQVGQPQVAGGVGKDHGVEPRQPGRRQHPRHVLRRPAELDRERARVACQPLEDLFRHGNRRVAEAGRVGSCRA